VSKWFSNRKKKVLEKNTGTLLWAAGACAAGLGLWLLRRKQQPRFDGASVLITGGSRGLGLALARRFAREGARLTLLARDGDELERARKELARTGADVIVYECDVGDPDQVDSAVRFVCEKRGRIDVLVNNAGIIQVGPVENMTLADFQEALDVHTWGPLRLMRAVIPQMKAQGEGRIVNISSIGGLVAVPHLLPYVVSKFALTGLSDGMRSELSKDNIQVTTVCPGLMRTGSHVNALFKGKHRQEFTWFALSSGTPLSSTSARRAARQIVEACRRGTARLIITPQARLLHGLNALAPDLTATVFNAIARLLPAPNGDDDHKRHPGWASATSLVPSLLTRLADRAALRNNELDDETAAVYHDRHE
jgi:NAD(P)-dependent dehydrogenase (short-subunit alcohol dehydrogenase family)